MSTIAESEKDYAIEALETVRADLIAKVIGIIQCIKWVNYHDRKDSGPLSDFTDFLFYDNGMAHSAHDFEQAVQSRLETAGMPVGRVDTDARSGLHVVRIWWLKRDLYERRDNPVFIHLKERRFLDSDCWPNLVCLPYSVENLHAMAKALGIHRGWFHGKGSAHPHYDIPKRRIAEIMAKCRVVESREIVYIISGYRNNVDEIGT